MGVFSWLFGGSKKAAQKRAETMRKRVEDKAAAVGAAVMRKAAEKSRVVHEPIGQDPWLKRLEKAMAQQEKDYEYPSIDETPWHKLKSTNVDSIRYHKPSRLLQVKFLDTSVYEYEHVEPSIFMGFLRTHSPGQYRWYVLGDPRSPSGVHYNYRKIGGGGTTLPPIPASRFAGSPFRISKKIQRILKKKPGTGAIGIYAVGVTPPPSSYKG